MVIDETQEYRKIVALPTEGVDRNQNQVFTSLFLVVVALPTEGMDRNREV